MLSTRRRRTVTSCDTTAGSKRRRLLFTGDVDEMFMTRSFNVSPKTTELLWYTVGTLYYSLGRLVTIGTVMVKNSQETVKTAKMTIGVPIVTCLLRVRRIHKALPQPVRPWKSGRVHLAEGSNVLLF